jgi:hypothetical protein
VTLLRDAEVWAADGIAHLFDEYVRAPQEFTTTEIHALVRAAYGVGYVDSLGGGPGPPLSILSACQYAEALRLTLPLSS